MTGKFGSGIALFGLAMFDVGYVDIQGIASRSNDMDTLMFGNDLQALQRGWTKEGGMGFPCKANHGGGRIFGLQRTQFFQHPISTFPLVLKKGGRLSGIATRVFDCGLRASSSVVCHCHHQLAHDIPRRTRSGATASQQNDWQGSLFRLY
jgi:hypothetical protein